MITMTFTDEQVALIRAALDCYTLQMERWQMEDTAGLDDLSAGARECQARRTDRALLPLLDAFMDFGRDDVFYEIGGIL